MPLLHPGLELLAVTRHALLEEVHGEIVQGELIAVQSRLHGNLRTHLSRTYHEDPLHIVGSHGISSLVERRVS